MKLRPSFRKMVFGTIFFASAVLLRAEVAPDSAPFSPANLPLKQIEPGTFQVGSVRLNKDQKTIHFPAAVNMTNGMIEYFVVTGTGKLHESILKTETEPAQIHIAMLLIGAQGAGTNSSGTNISGISGDKFTIEVSWKKSELEKRASAEDLIFNTETKSPMSKGDWIYNGSKVIDGTFIAQRDGSIVSIISDPLAVANTAHPGRDNDEIWSVNTNAVPPLNTPVEVTFKLEWPQNNAENTKETK